MNFQKEFIGFHSVSFDLKEMFMGYNEECMGCSNVATEWNITYLAVIPFGLLISNGTTGKFGRAWHAVSSSPPKWDRGWCVYHGIEVESATILANSTCLLLMFIYIQNIHTTNKSDILYYVNIKYIYIYIHIQILSSMSHQQAGSPSVCRSRLP